MCPLSPYRLSLLGSYFFGFLPTLPVALIPLYFSVWLAGETERQGKEESCSRGGGRQLFLCPQYLPCSPLLHSTLRPPTVPSGPGPNPSRLTCLPIYRDHLLALICSLCGPGRSCPVSLVTFSHIPCLLHLILETNLDFLQRISHFYGPHVRSAQRTLWPD